MATPPQGVHQEPQSGEHLPTELPHEPRWPDVRRTPLPTSSRPVWIREPIQLRRGHPIHGKHRYQYHPPTRTLSILLGTAGDSPNVHPVPLDRGHEPEFAERELGTDLYPALRASHSQWMAILPTQAYMETGARPLSSPSPPTDSTALAPTPGQTRPDWSRPTSQLGPRHEKGARHETTQREIATSKGTQAS